MKKTVVITGGSSGIGLACAKKFAEQGFDVYELSRHGKSDGEISHKDCDVTDESAVFDAFQAISAESGQIDIVISNAGFGISGAVEFTALDEAKTQFDVNFFGALNTARAAIPHLRKSRGRLIFISSAAAIFPIPFQSFYAASKTAVNSLSGALRNELKPFGISVCALMPGDVKTGFTNARRHNERGGELYGRKMHDAISSMEKDEINGMTPEFIAKKVYHYATKRRVAPQYTLGGKYKLFSALLRILPTSAVNCIIGKMYG